MPDKFAPVDDDRSVFRLAKDTHVPPGTSTPLRSWLVLTSDDKVHAAARNREPGLSGFDQNLASPEQARTLLGWNEARALALTVAQWKQIGVAHRRLVVVVYAPLEQLQPRPGWDGHVLIEGTRKPAGVSSSQQYDYLDAICQAAR